MWKYAVQLSRQYIPSITAGYIFDINSLKREEKKYLRRWLSSGLLHHVVWWRCLLPPSSGDHPEVGGSKHLWNIGERLPDYMVQQPIRQSSAYLPLWEPEISPRIPSYNITYIAHMNFDSEYLSYLSSRQILIEENSYLIWDYLVTIISQCNSSS
jgi:hypothetical protein